MLYLYQKGFVSLCKIKVRQGSCDELVAHSQNKTFACTQTDSLDERETIFVLHQILTKNGVCCFLWNSLVGAAATKREGGVT